MANLPAIQSKFSNKEITLLKNTYAKELTDPQFELFMMQSKAMDLNPFNKEIYAMNLKGRLVIMTSIQGLRKIAHGTDSYLGCKVNVQWGEKIPISATAIVKKIVQGKIAEFEYTAMFDEFTSGRDNWVKMPQVMISKVAEAQALRMAFSKCEQAFEASEMVAIERNAHETIEVDVMPEYEGESQELRPVDDPKAELAALKNAKSPPNVAPQSTKRPAPGEFMVKYGSRKTNPTRIKHMPMEEINKFLSWAVVQEALTPEIQEYFEAASKYVTEQEGK